MRYELKFVVFKLTVSVGLLFKSFKNLQLRMFSVEPDIVEEKFVLLGELLTNLVTVIK